MKLHMQPISARWGTQPLSVMESHLGRPEQSQRRLGTPGSLPEAQGSTEMDYIYPGSDYHGRPTLLVVLPQNAADPG